ncbi:hypothetical protein OVN18_04210 [Microcella daejeonensis]|uniref:Uncharacterized protein n=1 Tax=Microcella daejeonensis TaxID=2994971 RepID=A0A9E8S9N4_9MICO|nr:hypothetical protein [Microcella daejeonensis]WAB82219.1 hypothetical protein OVN18_04210 [Microcella daejeonensis]
MNRNGSRIPETSTTAVDGTRAVPARRRLIGAWVAVALIPVGVVAAFVIGGALAGEDPESSGIAVIVRAGIIAVSVMLIAPVAAIVLGEGARRRGARSATIPLVIGIVTAAWAVIVNTLPLLLASLLGG